MKKIIIAVDDFGASSDVNKVIIDLAKRKKIDAASLIVNMSGSEEAINFCKKNKIIVGVHLNISAGKPISDNVKSLVNKEGYFNMDIITKSFFGFINKEEIEKEFRAQIEKVKNSGVKINYINSHHYIHVFPFVIDTCLKLAKEYKINYVSLPKEKLWDKKYLFSMQNFKRIIINLLCFCARKKMVKNNIKFADGFFGFLHSKDLSTKTMKKLFTNLNEGVNEIVFHPGYGKFDNVKGSNIDKIFNLGTDHLNRDEEFKLLDSEEFLNLIKESKLERSSYD